MSVLWNSVQSVLVVVLIMILGYGLQKAGWLSKDFGQDITKLIMNIALPASIFVTVLQKLTRNNLINFSGYLFWGVVSVAIGYLFAFVLVKIMKIQPGRQGIFINSVVNDNTIFVGLPLNVALFGSKSMGYFLVYYLLNTFSTWTVGVMLINNDDPKERKSSHINWRQILSMPLISFVVALVVLLLDVPILKLTFVNSTLTYVGNLVTPLSLIYIGIVLAKAGLKSIQFDRDTTVALIGRFIFSPIVMIILMLIASKTMSNLPSLLSQTMIVQAATPMLTVTPILAANAHGDVKYATNVVTTSTILFIIVIPILMMVIQYL